jgi:hypothetical protein
MEGETWSTTTIGLGHAIIPAAYITPAYIWTSICSPAI